MGIRQWFNNPEEKRAFNEVERLWPDLAKWAETAVISRSNKAALDRMREDAVLRRMYRAAAAKFYRFDKFILRVVPGMRLEVEKTAAEAIDLRSDEGWATLEENGVFLASRLVLDQAKSDLRLVNILNAAKRRLPVSSGTEKVCTLFVDIELEAVTYGKDAGQEQRIALAGLDSMVLLQSGRLRVANLTGDAFWIPVAFEAGPSQVFVPSPGPVVVRFYRGGGMRPVASCAYPQWWGGRPGAPPSTNVSALNLALRCFHEEGVVRVPGGQYAIDDTIEQTGGSAPLVGEPTGGTTLVMHASGRPAVKARGLIRTLVVKGHHLHPSVAPRFQTDNPNNSPGIHFCGGSVGAHDIRVTGFPVGIYARPPVTPGKAFYMNDASLRNVRLDNVTWGYVMDTGGNHPRFDPVRVSDANVGILFPRVQYDDGKTALNAPEACMNLRRSAFDHVQHAFLAEQNIVAPLVDGCSFEVVKVGVQLVPDGLRTGPGSVGPCLFEDCPVPVQATTGTGNEPLPWLAVACPGGTAPQPPAAGAWDVGDRVDSDRATPVEGDPAGWICTVKT